MSRLILALCTLGLLSACGCSKKSTESSKAGDGGAAQQTRAALPKEAVAIAEVFVKEAHKGQECEITMTKDVGVIFKKKPATAVQVRFKIKGEEGEKNVIFLVQDGVVQNQIDYDPAKALDDNAKALVLASE